LFRFGILYFFENLNLNIGSRAVMELARGEMDKVIVSGTRAEIILRGVGSDAVLSAITKPGANLGLLLVGVRRAAKRIAYVLRAV